MLQKFLEPKYTGWRWVFCISNASYLYLFVTFCEPFKDERITYMWDSNGAYVLHSLLNFAVAVLSCAFSFVFIPHYFPNYFSPEKAATKRFGFWVFISALAIEIGYFLLNHVFFHDDLSLAWFLAFMFKVSFISLFFIGLPFLFVYIILFNYFTNPKKQVLIHSEVQKLEDSKSLDCETDLIESTEIAPPQYKSEEAPIMLNFNDTTNKKQITLPLDRLYYIASAQNYIEIFYKNQNGKLSKQLLRNTLKTVEEELFSNANLPLVRCHKGFIVNYDKVLEMQGNSRNAYFILMDTDAQIPISRHKIVDFQEKNQILRQIF